ncbi:MAG: hypothetical protein FWC41_09560 [Firmicutes bacterium]|nr:hypothetical protein [Bacillota bacterium]
MMTHEIDNKLRISQSDGLPNHYLLEHRDKANMFITSKQAKELIRFLCAFEGISGIDFKPYESKYAKPMEDYVTIQIDHKKWRCVIAEIPEHFSEEFANRDALIDAFLLCKIKPKLIELLQKVKEHE